MITKESDMDHDSGYAFGFVDGMKSERKKLTAWNSPSEPPDHYREILLKVNGGYHIGRYCFGDMRHMLCAGGDWLVNGCAFPEHMILGWREIHEEDLEQDK